MECWSRARARPRARARARFERVVRPIGHRMLQRSSKGQVISAGRNGSRARARGRARIPLLPYSVIQHSNTLLLHHSLAPSVPDRP